MRRLVALLAAFLMLLPASAFGANVFFCKMRNSVGASCCCKSDDTTIVRDVGQQRFEQASCCTEQRIGGNAARTAVSSASDMPELAATLTHLLPISALIQAQIEELAKAPARARGPPRVAAPLFILNRTFLS